ncbi:MAG: hypothetical protein KIT84_11750 [Labilithrix sp.]|nr:hypothetical protein [Labilithrix sp.]MCW5811684.1 hypothetical protein [Labilithrix sp.]
MDVVAIVALGRHSDQEAPLLAADLGLTTYETGVMLRAPTPIIVYRSEDRARTADLASKLRARGHDAVACDLDSVVSSDDMFRPKTFQFEGSELVGHGNGEQRRVALADVFALVRATHQVQSVDTTTTHEKTRSLSRAFATGGLVTTKTVERESQRVTNEREPVLYLFRGDGDPWLLGAQSLRYGGLAGEMKVSKAENFEVLIRLLRSLAPQATYDARLLQVRVGTQIISSGSKHMTSSSAGAVDILAHIVATALNRAVRPYR